MTQEFRDVKYRTFDGRADYVFRFVFDRQRASWRVYIVDQPAYQGRSESMHDTHRLGSSGDWYVCWTKPMRTLDAAKQVAALWADCTQLYIRTNYFGEPTNRPEVSDRTPMAGFVESPGLSTALTDNKTADSTQLPLRERLARFLG